MTWEFKENSLDAIRLLAATQVAVLHTCEFMFVERTGGVFFELLRLFPGVPIFFSVSGYLISKSYESTPNIAEYAKKHLVITIAHRLNTVKNAKQLIVMENGCIAQHGDFKALSQQSGEFAKLLQTAQHGATND